LNGLALGQATRPASFWQFAGSVVAGNVAALGAAYLTRAATRGETESTRNTAAAFTGIAAFWLVGGLTWVMLTKKNGASA
jgi:hypothetical protein